ncbi:hypothetical protein [Salinarchaeum laminariae]|uniref:hypothetical protein n=1 Tax=Salinarchaeum laminariae TaxID=869888 RepID=UPI0020BE603D|nr:hypothetical protein [Salinarchaeum laminariae]
MNAERLERVTTVAGMIVGVGGGALAVAGTLSPEATPADVAFLLLGLVCVPLGLVIAAAGRRLANRTEASDSLLVRGGFGLHLFALLVTVVLGMGWLLRGAGSVPVAAGCWGFAAAGYAGLSYGWDRATGTDVDAV